VRPPPSFLTIRMLEAAFSLAPVVRGVTPLRSMPAADLQLSSPEQETLCRRWRLAYSEPIFST
jgi:hypothetical protein